MNEIVFVLGVPAGRQPRCIVRRTSTNGSINVLFQPPRLLSRQCCSPSELLGESSISAFGRLFSLVDSFNVFPGDLDGVERLYHGDFQPSLHAERAAPRLTARMLRLYHSMYQLFVFTMPTAPDQQHGGAVGGDGGGVITTTVLLVGLYHRRPASSGMEVLHPVRRRHRPGTVRRYPAVFRGREVLGAGGTALL